MATLETFPVLDISDWRLAGVEPTGLTPHYWYRQPDAPELWLFKPVEVPDGRVLGDDWSEKVASEVASLLEIPAARIELARRATQVGCISQNLIPRKWEMQEGAVLLAGTVPGYRSRIPGRAGHSTVNIQLALDRFGPPPNSILPADFGAYDVFVGYLIFDALIANKDRHDGNWAVLRPPSDRSVPDALCGSFDHASSLGFNLTDAERSHRLAHGLVKQWALRGDAYGLPHLQKRLGCHAAGSPRRN